MYVMYIDNSVTDSYAWYVVFITIVIIFTPFQHV